MNIYFGIFISLTIVLTSCGYEDNTEDWKKYMDEKHISDSIKKIDEPISDIELMVDSILNSDDTNPPFIQKEVDELYSIEVPSYMKEMNLGNQAASFEYGDEVKEHYVMVIVNTEQGLIDSGIDLELKSYAEEMILGFENVIEECEIIKKEDEIQEINGLEVIRYTITGFLPDFSLGTFYYVAFYKSESYYYYLSTWTLDNRAEAYMNNCEKIIHSFKEI